MAPHTESCHTYQYVQPSHEDWYVGPVHTGMWDKYILVCGTSTYWYVGPVHTGMMWGHHTSMYWPPHTGLMAPHTESCDTYQYAMSHTSVCHGHHTCGTPHKMAAHTESWPSRDILVCVTWHTGMCHITQYVGPSYQYVLVHDACDGPTYWYV